MKKTNNKSKKSTNTDLPRIGLNTDTVYKGISRYYHAELKQQYRVMFQTSKLTT